MKWKIGELIENWNWCHIIPIMRPRWNGIRIWKYVGR